ncbi:MAG: hypothetical protein JWP10_113 [Nocardioidaceae bacterium]|nr:hypothetical protein [Nocardioidaceae bacterium]
MSKVVAKKPNIRLRQGYFADPRSTAAVAAKFDSRFKKLAKTPQALWVTDGYTVDKVKGVMQTYAKLAAKKKKTPVIAIYGIPNRDCGGFSSGGLTSAEYKRWIAKIASGLKNQKAIAILEPDAVAQAAQSAHCNDADRAGLMRYATRKLTKAGVWVYIDAGHSNWLSAATMAAGLKASGIAGARGFSTNVSSYQPTANEVAYAELLRAELRKLGITGKHYVVETARNGAGAAFNSDFCNPPQARIGTKPRTIAQGAFDAMLWVKHPGESDGTCNGGPNPGVWWPDNALQLLGH